MSGVLRPSRIVAVVITLTVVAGACHSLELAPPLSGLDERASGRILRVTDRRGAQVRLGKAHAEGDSLIGVTARDVRGAPERIALPAADIAYIELEEFSPANTLLLLLGLAAAGTVALVATVAIIFAHGPSH